MHIEIQVALNFVISYLYNKLPRRRVNIFGEELEKALRDKFQGHWYPEKPFKGSAYRCLKTGDPIDAVLARAARESGVPISDILENLPNELSVWVDPGEVSYRIGEKGAVKILYTENNENHEDSHSADREVTKTFNPEAQCFRPIDAVNTTMNNLSLSPKALPLPSLGTSLPPAGSSPHSAASSSPTYKGSPNPNGSGSSGGSLAGSNNNAAATATAAAFVQRAAQAPLTFTTATFAQTKFGSTKLKTSSKRTNSSYRMSPTEFSNYIKQRAMQQQLHHGHGSAAAAAAFGGLDAVSPARSLSPNPLALGAAGNQSNASTGNNGADPFYYPNMAMGLYPQYNGQRNLYEPHFNADAGNLGLIAGGSNTFSTYLEPCYFTNGQQQQQQLEHANSSESCFGLDTECSMVNINEESINPGESSADSSPIATPTAGVVVSAINAVTAAVAETPVPASSNSGAGSAVSSTAAATAAATTAATATATATTAAAAATAATTAANNQQQDSATAAASNNKLIDGLSSFYGSGSTYQQLLVAN
ncbi:protein Tob1 isoform X2 [Drosophila innubila]|uniref:protein Tob1 isoform X2 n=1 Tax=Drosophila innubila TaxID=198719 RepID=UPI00148B8480|nr:protein Tob1 isoform X2 [Drosophila innubila]